ncbi:histidine phosphatase family protein [uncultured Limosilactobacillus sp.]|uniref:histidine phosphatase family protein n=1 Tax=uncultured Limosilactobacillus sp. TaxID=2837629 RepID=UPI0025F21B99|nr:histidine phosphatase family protein [uncultured Limosilactobacillus sp.]
MELYLVRHGQSEANAAHILQGSKVDTPLTEKGRQQAVATKERLAGIHFEQVFTSPLRRASETAAIIAGTSINVTFDPRLVEFDYGKWDGQRIEQLFQDYPMVFQEGHFQDTWQISGGESYSATKQRLTSFMQSLPTECSGNILIVSHGMTIKLWMAFLLGIQFPERIAEPANASFSQISFHQNRPVLKVYSG